MSRRDGRDASFLIGLVLGMAMGGAAAIVLAPRSSEETRERLSAEAQRARQALEAKRAEVSQEMAALATGTRKHEKFEVEKAQEKVEKAKEDVARADEAAAKSNEQVQEAAGKLVDAKNAASEAAKEGS